MTWRANGLVDVARHVTRCRYTQENADDVAGNHIFSLPADRNVGAEVITRLAVGGDKLSALGPRRRRVSCDVADKDVGRAHLIVGRKLLKGILESSLYFLSYPSFKR